MCSKSGSVISRLHHAPHYKLQWPQRGWMEEQGLDGNLIPVPKRRKDRGRCHPATQRP